MKTNLDKVITGTVVAAVPLLVAVGCAGDGLNLSQTEAVSEQVAEYEHSYDQEANSLEESNATAIANMEGYMAKLTEDTAEVETAEIMEIAEPEAESVHTNSGMDEAEQLSLGSMTDEELLVAEILGQGVVESTADEGKLVLPPPEKMVFHFGFNKNELEVSDIEVIKQHAAYLIQNQNYILHISGHADNHGKKLYNQSLSELRAQKVADLLIADGVPESQLRVDGMGDSVPMVSPDDWQKNRRVEFVYQDSMMAINH